MLELLMGGQQMMFWALFHSLTNPQKPIERKMFRDILALLAVEFSHGRTNTASYSFGEDIGLPEGRRIEVVFKYLEGAEICEGGEDLNAS